MQSESGVTLNSKTMKSEILCRNIITFRADKIDLTDLDAELEKRFCKLLAKSIEAKRLKESWEIDLAKLDINYAIANGGYGTVFRGYYENQDVAVKLLDWGEDGVATAAETATLRALFRHEVTLWQKLDHPNVTKFIGASAGNPNLKIPITDFGHVRLPSKACCLISEFLHGGTLKSYLSRNKKNKLDYKVVIKLALDLSRGLSYLHSKNIVHRDVKTDNLLLDANRNLKIADFGVACVEAMNPNEMTGGIGTYGYMAPEVMNGKPYNRKCDVYAFGICLWEIYCCNTPFSKLSIAAATCGIVRHNFRPKIPRCCPSDLSKIMKKCWDANPERRPEMHEVVKMLEAIDTSKGGGMIPEDKTATYFCFGPSRHL